MKKILALLMILAMLLSMSGCLYIDEQRTYHAVIEKEGELLRYLDHQYKRLPEYHQLLLSREPSDAGTVFITKKDVPLLLCKRYSVDYGYTYNDRQFLEADGLYCRDDLYEQTIAAINAAANPDRYCYTEGHFDGNIYREEFSLLPKEINAAIEQTMATGETLTVHQHALYDHITTLYRCTKDLLRGEACYEIYLQNGMPYMLETAQLANDPQTVTLRKVPEELQEQFDFIYSLPLPLYEPEI